VIQMTKSMNFAVFLSDMKVFFSGTRITKKANVEFSNISEDISVWTLCIVLCFLFLLALCPLLYLFFVIVACLNRTHLLIFF
jgi:hypothetical protein